MNPLTTACLFAALLGSDPVATSRVADLGHRRFAAREAADKHFRQRPSPALILALLDGDLERSRRASRILEGKVAEFYEVMPSNYPWVPQMDMIDPTSMDLSVPGPAVPSFCGYTHPASLWSDYYRKAESQGLGSGRDYQLYRGAMVLYLRDMRDKGHSKAKLRKFLDEVVVVEKAWYKHTSNEAPTK